MSEHARHAMGAEEALWVREHAWTTAMRRDFEKWPDPNNSCTCRRLQSRNGDGSCSQCREGNHDACDLRMEGWTASTPAGWVTDRAGRVPSLGGASSWQIWDATVDHDPRCTCYTSGHPERTVVEAVPVGAVQGDLLSLLEAA